jgi:hypothetical protein
VYYAVLALAAANTSRIRLAPVTAQIERSMPSLAVSFQPLVDGAATNSVSTYCRRWLDIGRLR